MSTNRIFTDPKPQQFKSDGVSVNSYGKIYFYEPGSGTTKKAIYSNPELTTQLINPVLMDDIGRLPAIYMQDSDYAIRCTTSDDVQIYRVNNYQPAIADGQFEEWSAAITYGIDDYVGYSDGNYYISLKAANKAKTPSSSPDYWSQVFFITYWNETVTYITDDIVFYEGSLYKAASSVDNINHQPDISPTKWSRIGRSQFEGWSSVSTYYSGDFVKYIDDNYYISRAETTNDNPSANSSVWSQAFFITLYNSSRTYAAEELVYYSGALYEAIDSSAGVTPGTDYSKWVVAGSPSIKSGYTAVASNYYRDETGTYPSNFDVVANLTQGVYETVGPAGSGADHIWANYSPSSTPAYTRVILDVAVSSTKTTGADANFRTSTSFRSDGGYASSGPRGGSHGGATVAGAGYGSGQVSVPINSAGVFEVRYTEFGAPDTSGVSFGFLGFGL